MCGEGATGGRSRVLEVEGTRERAAGAAAVLRPRRTVICGPHTIDRPSSRAEPPGYAGRTVIEAVTTRVFGRIRATFSVFRVSWKSES